MLAKLVRRIFEDSTNMATICAYVTVLAAFYLQKLSWWILIIFVALVLVMAIISSIWFGGLDKKTAKISHMEQKLFTRMWWVTILSGVLICLPIFYFLNTNPYNEALIIATYVITFRVLYHNLVETRKECQ
ncbi:MAG: hypothetical protein HYT65_03510 [Candidatus Yanofskybacteria bacterium]|nr:hypothetical protein [Candidatus Yanofskybacteria bacterium]